LYIVVTEYQVASNLIREFPPGTATPHPGAGYLWVQLAFYSQAHEARRIRMTANAEYGDFDLRPLPVVFLVSPFAGEIIGPELPRIPVWYVLEPGTVKLYKALFLLPQGADATQVRVIVNIEIPVGLGSAPRSLGFSLENVRGRP
jgi:hypothetical protein